MSVKERLLAIKIIKRNETHPDFVKAIGVTTEMVVNKEKINKGDLERRI